MTTTMWRAHQALDRIADWAPIAGLLRRRYDRRFENNRGANLFRGVFTGFDDARRSAPSSRPVGYDNPASAQLYAERMRKAYATDYPVLFWLQKLLAAGHQRIFDLGGHVGVTYYAYRRYLELPAGLGWQVHDVPAVVDHGRRMAAEHDPEGRLSFCDGFDEADGAPVLVALGSLQYLPDTLPDLLARLAAPPSHLLLNLVPLHEQHDYYTLQSIGTAFCPYRISARGAFVASFEALGYELVDQWENPEKRCDIPFHPDRSLDRYHGLYLRRRA
jgi:putative methyltransferase (TIGR04325 family)